MSKLRAVLFDLAGTICDKYSLAPALAFKRTFQKRGLNVGMKTIRAYMGLSKINHIKKILEEKHVEREWANLYGYAPGKQDEENLYHEFLTHQTITLERNSELIFGAKSVFYQLRSRDIRIGATTGYSEEIVNILEPMLNAQGLHFDFLVTSSDVENGRPHPDMIFKNMEFFGISDPKSVLIVDDSNVGIEAGKRAGVHTAGVYKFSNHVGIDSKWHEAAITRKLLRAKRQNSFKMLKEAQADFVIPSVSDLFDIID